MTNLKVEKKDFTVALLLWLFLGGLGAHRCFIKGSIHYIFWYWLAIICTLSGILWYDLFTMKKAIDKRHMEDEMKEQYLRNQYSQK